MSTSSNPIVLIYLPDTWEFVKQGRKAQAIVLARAKPIQQLALIPFAPVKVKRSEAVEPTIVPGFGCS